MEEKRIRKRRSYWYFKALLRFLRSKPGEAEILRKFHEAIDQRFGFNSRTNSFCAKESMELLLKDEGF